LLQALDALDFYRQHQAKSLGREWIAKTFWPVVSDFELSAENLLATLNMHVARQIASVITACGAQTVLVTGGGAFNDYLIRNIQNACGAKLIIPDEKIIQYKEALIFAFLGVLRLRGENNVLQQVTGSKKNNMGGALWG
jgi:anhydro-N-acetylmuramic acid kinase